MGPHLASASTTREFAADGRRAARAARAGADARTRRDQAGALRVGRQHARGAARPRARPAARARLQRRLPRRRRGVRRQAPAAVHRALDDASAACRGAHGRASSAPARWAPASRRSPRRRASRAAVRRADRRRRRRRSARSPTRSRKLAAKGKLVARRSATRPRARIDAVARARRRLRRAKLVVEAIVEDLEAKRELFRELEVVVAADAILATNTSSLSITALARGLKHPGRVVGMHFFNPAPVLPLVEVVSGLATDAGGRRRRVYDTARGVGQDAGACDVDAGLHRQPLRAAVLRARRCACSPSARPTRRRSTR